MSWHCSRALEAVFSGVSSLDGEPSAQSKSTPTAGECSCSDKTTECSNHSRFGTTFARSTEQPGMESWMLCLRDSRASRLALPGPNSESMTSGTCGPKPSESFAKWGPDSRSWRTSQLSLLANTSEKYSATWPKAGLMRDGRCFQRRRAVPRIFEQEFFSLQPPRTWNTPCARDFKGYTKRAGESICNQLREIFPNTSGVPHPEFACEVMGFPREWTSLEPLATDKFQQWLEQHGVYSADNNP